MNKNVKIGLIVLVILIVLVGFWKLSAPKKVTNEVKNLPPVPQPTDSATATPTSADGTSSLDADLLATTGTQDTNDAVITSNEGLIADEPA